ncbi:MAG: nickel-dependent hydrogenase large subunit [Acidobacteriota bacterium]|jgi:NADH-quinone oxidoreductase subunit D|nr:nickel-dependent hydrogenase large subunit [Acidobacteriota bacterium]
MVNPEKIVKIPIGPQHPALKEPACFTVSLNGEKLVDLDLRLGYNHRGVEKAAEGRTYTQNMYLFERVCGICSHSHATCFIQCVEEVAGLEVPPRGRFLRTLIGELERIHSHFLWLGVAAHEIGFDTLLMYSWRDREVVMDLLAMLTGNRVNYAANVIGGAKHDVTDEQKAAILKAVDTLEERTKYYIEVASEETTLIARLSNVGRISLEDVKRLGTVGPTARASGLSQDARRDDPYAAYKEVPFSVITDTHCDVYGRTLVRVGELMESYKIIRYVLQNLPDGPIAAKAPRKIPAGEAVSRYEAPRGEDVHYVRGNGTEKPERVRVRAPTMVNLLSVPKMLEGNNLADVPITVAAIDPCFSCTDRAIRVADADGGNAQVFSWEESRRFGIDWYRKNGVDFTDVNKRLAQRLK